MILDWRRSFVPHFKDEIVCLKKQPIYAESFTFSGQILALNLSTYKQNYYVVKKSFLVSFSCPSGGLKHFAMPLGGAATANSINITPKEKKPIEKGQTIN